jgi:hypothetical protein
MKVIALTITLVTAITSLAAPAHADDEALTGYQPPHVVNYTGGLVPSYAHLETRANTKVIELGLASAGAVYALTVLYALGTCGAQMACRSGSEWLYVPVVGPFMTAWQAPTSGGATLSVFDGTLQALGVGVAVAGVLLPRTVVVWQDPEVSVRITPVPTVGGGGFALTMTGW